MRGLADYSRFVPSPD